MPVPVSAAQARAHAIQRRSVSFPPPPRGGGIGGGGLAAGLRLAEGLGAGLGGTVAVAAARGETAGDASLLDLSAVLVFGFALDAPAGADAGVGGAVAVGAGLARLWGTFRSAESVAMGASVGSEYRSMTHPWFAGSDARLPL
jgi:hypothetical protein